MATTYEDINSLEEFSMIGGESRLLTFLVTDENDAIVDVTAGSASWVLSPFGDPSFKVLEKTATLSGTPTNEFTVQLELADTQNLSGKFIQQAVFTDFYGNEYRKQGFVTIIARIN